MTDPPTDRVGNLRFRLPQAISPYVGKHNATAFGLSCPQQATSLPIPNGLPQETLDALSSLPGAGTTLADGEDCEGSIEDALCPMESNSDDSCRFEPQRHFACARQTQFKAPGCGGMFYVLNGMLSLVLIVITHMAVDIWR